MTTTPNMGLEKPIILTTAGPQYATDINGSLDTVDTHDHSSGKGKRVNTAGINIDEDLTFSSKNATGLRSTRYINHDSPLNLTADKACVYFSGGNFYINNGDGTSVKITDGTGLNLSSVGTIGGDYGQPGIDASVIYTDTTKTYSFTQASGITAKMAIGDILLYENISGANPITIKSPASLSSAYTVTMPTASPAANAIMKQKSDGSGLEFSTSPLYIDQANSRVAIGTTSVDSGSLFHTKATASRYVYIESVGGSNQLRIARTGDNTSDMYISSNNDALRLKDSGLVERFTFTASGNLGINKSAPTAPLDMVGTFNTTGTIQGARVRGTNTGDYACELARTETVGDLPLLRFSDGGGQIGYIGVDALNDHLILAGAMDFLATASFTSGVTKLGASAVSNIATDYDVLNFPKGSLFTPKIGASSTITALAANAVWDGSTLKYITSTAAATLNAISSGDFQLKTFPIGTAGAALPAGTINVSGNPTSTTIGTPLTVTSGVETTSGNGVIKWKKFTGTTSGNGVIVVTHGLDVTKIIGFEAIVYRAGTDWQQLIQLQYTSTGVVDGTNYVSGLSSDPNTYSRPYAVIIKYTA